MNKLTNFSAPKPKRRLPLPSFGIYVNFCRTPQYELFTSSPDPSDKRGRPSGKIKSNEPRGTVGGTGDEKTYKCGACGQQSIVKNNGAIVEEITGFAFGFNPGARVIFAQASPVIVTRSNYLCIQNSIEKRDAQPKARRDGSARIP